MKTLLAVMALTLTTTAAQAKEAKTFCKTPAIADGGYFFVMSEDQKTAIIEEGSIMGNRPVANLNCVAVRDKGPHHPDRIYTTNLCRDERPGVGSYVVTVQDGGFAGLRTATIKQVKNVEGKEVLAHIEYGYLTCPRRF